MSETATEQAARRVLRDPADPVAQVLAKAYGDAWDRVKHLQDSIAAQDKQRQHDARALADQQNRLVALEAALAPHTLAPHLIEVGK